MSPCFLVVPAMLLCSFVCAVGMGLGLVSGLVLVSCIYPCLLVGCAVVLVYMYGGDGGVNVLLKVCCVVLIYKKVTYICFVDRG